MKIRWIPGATKDGEVFAGVRYETDDFTAELYYVIKETSFRFIDIRFAGSDLSGTDLRQLPVGAIKEQIRRRLPEDPKFSTWGAHIGDEEQSRRVEEALRLLPHSRPKRGPGQKNPEHWAFVAETYLYCVQRYGQKAIKGMVEEVPAREPEIYWSKSTCKTYVRRARELKWLTKGKQGVAGAEPGPKLLAWRKEHQQ